MQDKSVCLLGELALENQVFDDPADIYIQNPYPNKDFTVFYFVFEIKNEAKFKEIDFEKLNSESNWKKLAYRKGSSSGGDITFSTKFSKKKKDKNTFENIRKKFDSWEKCFNRIKAFDSGKYNIEREIFSTIEGEFKELKDDLKEKFFEKIKDIDKKVPLFISMKIIKGGEESYLYDYKLLREMILKDGLEKKYKTRTYGESRAFNKIGSVEKNRVNEVYGFAFPFTFSTVDKPGSIAGFFNAKNNWRNYPVSKEAALLLEKGAEYITQKLVGNFWGNRYYIIPNPVLASDKKNFKKIVGLLQTALQEEAKAERKARAEERVMKKIAAEKNYFTVDLLFFETSNSALRIKMFLEEILPSRFRLLFVDVPNVINRITLFYNAIYDSKRKEYSDLTFNFGIVKTFFNNDFLDIVHKIFINQPISKSLLFTKFLDKFIEENKKKNSNKPHENLTVLIKKAFMLYYYLMELHLIEYNSKNQINMEATNTESKSRFELEKFQNFIKEHRKFFDSDIKIGLFALGILVRYVFDYQNQRLNSTPFENKLHGYRINSKQIQNIYTEALEKLKQYGGFYIYTDLREIIAKHFALNIKDLDKLSNSEISFYFVTGIELGKEFKKQTDEEE